MPYKDADVQRAYQRHWIAARRAEYLIGKVCVDCGTKNDLQIDHVDPRLKLSHNVWSWSEIRRNAELAKCTIRCKPCHLSKTMWNSDYLRSHNADPQTVQHVRSLYATGQYTQTEVAALTGLGVRAVNDMILRKTFRYLP